MLTTDCIDMWYSMITRIRNKSFPTPDQRRESFPVYYASKSVIDWSRMNVWASRDLVTNKVTAVVLRCPESSMKSFVSTFSGDKGSLLLQHPTLMHAHFTNGCLARSYDFLREFSVAMYDLVSARIYTSSYLC